MDTLFTPHDVIIELRAERPELLTLLRTEYGVEQPAVAGLRLYAKLAPGHDPDALIRRIASDPAVEFAERVPHVPGPVEHALSDYQQLALIRTSLEYTPPVPVRRSTKTKEEPTVYTLREHGKWAATSTQRPKAWDRLKLTNIAILDSGADATHPGLAGAVDFADTESRTDGYGHGTFVAYTIAGRPQEDMPLGVLPKSKVWVANVFTSLKLEGKQEFMLDAERYSKWLRALAARGTPRLRQIEVLNLSLGSLYESKALKKDLQAVLDAGVTVVAAAGNAPVGETSPVLYPAAYPDVISVGALAYSAKGEDRVWPRSNGERPPTKRRQPWDICAPGECILSGLPGESNALGVTGSGWMSGTSMAAPYVTAAVAVLRAQGVKSRDEIVERLRGMGRSAGDVVSLVCPEPAGKTKG